MSLSLALTFCVLFISFREAVNRTEFLIITLFLLLAATVYGAVIVALTIIT